MTVTALDLAWEAVNALGGVPQDEAGLAHCKAIDAALLEIEKLGGRDPAPLRRQHIEAPSLAPNI